ncbi:MAG: hypothetical protein LBN42_02070 [Oscillospiraceae bacterium]|jgi:hypothetical protein|nr:hypothetical protein [Oscillospiraceae bacterium]
MRYFYVDFENVHSDGLKGLEELTADDTVYFFYSDNANALTFDLLFSLENANCISKYYRSERTARNSLDFQIVTFIGANIVNHPDAKHIVITIDGGYDASVDFWNTEFAARETGVATGADSALFFRRFRDVRTYLIWASNSEKLKDRAINGTTATNAINSTVTANGTATPTSPTIQPTPGLLAAAPVPPLSNLPKTTDTVKTAFVSGGGGLNRAIVPSVRKLPVEENTVNNTATIAETTPNTVTAPPPTRPLKNIIADQITARLNSHILPKQPPVAVQSPSDIVKREVAEKTEISETKPIKDITPTPVVTVSRTANTAAPDLKITPDEMRAIDKAYAEKCNLLYLHNELIRQFAGERGIVLYNAAKKMLKDGSYKKYKDTITPETKPDIAVATPVAKPENKPVATPEVKQVVANNSVKNAEKPTIATQSVKPTQTQPVQALPAQPAQPQNIQSKQGKQPKLPKPEKASTKTEKPVKIKNANNAKNAENTAKIKDTAQQEKHRKINLNVVQTDKLTAEQTNTRVQMAEALLANPTITDTEREKRDDVLQIFKTARDTRNLYNRMTGVFGKARNSEIMKLVSKQFSEIIKKELATQQ